MIQNDIKTTMTGKEYLEYLKYKDAKNSEQNRKMSNHFSKHGLKYVIIGFLFATVMILYDMLTYTEPVRYSFEQYLQIGFVFLLFAIGISWIIHGVGFVIIKR